MRLLKILVITLSVITFFGCERNRNEPFNPELWNQYTEFKGFEHRESMIKSLANQHLHPGMPKVQVIELLGEYTKGSNLIEDSELAYFLTEDYGLDVDPVEVNYFVLKFNSDSNLESIWKRNWKRNIGSTEVRYKLPF